MARRRCPVCDRQFYVKTILLNMITRSCVHCGASLGKAGTESEDHPDDPSAGTRKF